MEREEGPNWPAWKGKGTHKREGTGRQVSSVQVSEDAGLQGGNGYEVTCAQGHVGHTQHFPRLQPQLGTCRFGGKQFQFSGRAGPGLGADGCKVVGESRLHA